MSLHRLCDICLRRDENGDRMRRSSETELGLFDGKMEAQEVVERAGLVSVVQFLLADARQPRREFENGCSSRGDWLRGQSAITPVRTAVRLGPPTRTLLGL